MESRYNTGGSNSCKTDYKSSILVSNQNSRSQNRSKPDDRPITSTGRYNMDFIDWNNEYEYIYNGSAIENEEDNNTVNGMRIPQGMARETFESLIVKTKTSHKQKNAENDQIQEQINKELDDNGLPEEILEKITTMRMGKSKRDCAVCFESFEQGCKIRKLPCTHIFHEHCITPWFQRNTTCPNCRLDLVKYFKEKPNG